MKSWPNWAVAVGYLALPFVLLLVFVVVPCVVSWVVLPGQHDAKLARLSGEMRALHHPSTSVLLAEKSEVGNFGNGHHLDYWAAQLRSIRGARSALKTIYGTARVAVPNHGEDVDDDAWQGVVNGKQPVEWEVLPSPLPARFHLQVYGRDQWDLSRFAGKQGLYVVQVVNSGGNNSSDALFDWRGG